MEDAHVTIANLAEAHSDDENSDTDASLFAVFDGHGGAVLCAGSGSASFRNAKDLVWLMRISGIFVRLVMYSGKEVAKFCQDHLASVLIKSQHYKERNYEEALKVRPTLS